MGAGYLMRAARVNQNNDAVGHKKHAMNWNML